MTSRELREKREGLIQQAAALKGPNGAFETDDKRAQFDKIMTDVEGLRQPIEDAERGEKLDAIQRTTLPETQRTAAADPDDTARKVLYERALGAYLRGVNPAEMSAEERTVLRGGYRSLSDVQRRDIASFGGAVGGYTVAPDTRFYGRLTLAMAAFGGMEQAGAEVITTDTAGPMPMNMSNDTGNTGARVPEAKTDGHASGTAPLFTQLVLGGYLYSSKIVKTSWQILRDSGIDIEARLGAMLGERLARIQNTEFTSYAGTTGPGPQGLTTVVSTGRQSATGNTTSIPDTDIYRTVHALDPAYRGPRCRWMFEDATCLALRLMKDGAGRFIWPELGSIQAGQPQMLAGYPIVINQDMPTMAASAVHTTFGDHFAYKIRRVGGITILRLNEVYAEEGQVGFLAYQTADGGYENPGTNPIVGLLNSAA